MLRMKNNLECFIDDFEEVNAYHSKNFFEGKSSQFHLKDPDGNIIPLELMEKIDHPNYIQYRLKITSPIKIGKKYEYFEDHCQPVPARYGHIVKTQRFNDEQAVKDQPLGMKYTPEKTTFTLWAPTATALSVQLEKPEGKQILAMKRGERGLWSLEVEEDLLGLPYTYLVEVNGELLETVDPYTPFLGANTSKSYVDDLSLLDLKPRVKMEPMESATDAIIYETSVRDFTAQLANQIDDPSTFKGFVELTQPLIEQKKGLAYLKDLGITHVQLMPVLDFGSVDEQNPRLYYNWGYDPAHYRGLEGSYSAHPENHRERLEDFSTLVYVLHENGIRVVLDVVFNHVYNKDRFALDRIVPDYYFLMNRQGEYSNGSFCGNDIDSRPAMSKQYLIDTCKYLVETFDIDGLRFDLMGILDYELMNEIEKECRKIKPDFIVYGEGWNMPSYVPEDLRASIENMAKMPRIGHFSDRFREVVKGSNGDLKQKGFALGNGYLSADAGKVLRGSIEEGKFDSPIKVINYAECHDNHTVWDKIAVACEGESDEFKKRKQVQAIAMVLMAQGIPFLHSGQEFARTKRGLGNTYNKEDSYNLIDYYRRDENQHMVDQTKKLIDIRKNHPSLRLSDGSDVLANTSSEVIDGQVVLYKASRDDDTLWSFFNSSDHTHYYTLPEEMEVLFDAAEVNKGKITQVQIAPFTSIVLEKIAKPAKTSAQEVKEA